MNEQELKNIWRREEKIPLKSIDMEFIQNYSLKTQNSLQKLSRKEMIAGFIASAIFVIDFIYSGNFYIVLTAMSVIWIYIVWSNRRRAKTDELERVKNVKSFLAGKIKKLKQHILLRRIIIFTGYILSAIVLHQMEDKHRHPGDNPYLYLIFLIVAGIIIQAINEIYIRINYHPILTDLRYLIEELEENE